MSQDPIQDFQKEVKNNINRLKKASSLKELSEEWINKTAPFNYSYNFNCLGRPIIQFPNDAWMMQELIWSCKPDLIIATGIAHGGSLILQASSLATLDICEAIKKKVSINPEISHRKVLGIDIDIRNHNKLEIESHPMSSRIEMIQGSSISDEVINNVKDFSRNYKSIMVCLDSNHTHNHVLAELKAYAPLVSKNSYCIVLDTIIEKMNKELNPGRPWGPGDNPLTAVNQYLKINSDFIIDKDIDSKLLVSAGFNGYLKKIC